MVALWAAMPQVQVAVSMKTHYHRNPEHQCKVNHVADIDALAIAYAYCDALLTDAEARTALVNSRELRAFGAEVMRDAQGLVDWLDALPEGSTPAVQISHPLCRPARVGARRPLAHGG